jgi:hypothetical protein
MNETPAPAPRWADEHAAADYLSVTTRTIQRYAADGLITRGGIGGIARYDLNELDAILRGDRTDPTEAVADALAKVRKALTPAGPQQLVHITRINAALDDIADELGISAGATRAG